MHFTSLAMAAVLSVAQATSVNVQVVSVGKNPVNGKTGLKYWPENITAEPGSMVQFQFLDGNHTVTQSNFDNPCVPISQIDPSKHGIWSSFMPVAASKDKGEIPVYTVLINDTKPLWFFCSQGPHCSKGMGMVINENTKANATRSLENYKKIAAGSAPGGEYGGGDGYGGGNGGYNPPATEQPPPPAETGAPPPAETAAPPATTEAPIVGGGGLQTSIIAAPPASTVVPPASNGTSPTGAPVAGRAPGFAVPTTLLAVLGAAAFVLL